MMLISLVVLWFICGAFAYGINMYDYQHQSYAYIDDNRAQSFILAIGGWCGLFGALMVADHIGLRFTAYTPDQRWKIFDSKFNSDGFVFRTREQFDEEYP